MASNIVLTFALLFGSVVSLICAVYSYKINKAIIQARVEQQSEVSE